MDQLRYNESGNVIAEEYWLNGVEYEDIFLYSVEVGSLKGE